MTLGRKGWTERCSWKPGRSGPRCSPTRKDAGGPHRLLRERWGAFSAVARAWEQPKRPSAGDG